MSEITLKHYDYDTGITEETGKVDTHTLARSMTPEQFQQLLSDYLNVGGKQLTEGENIGRLARTDHRTLQRLEIAFALGIVSGLADQEERFTDDRNHDAVMAAKKVKTMLNDTGELNIGMYV
jgi:hypothetical protein